MDTAATPEMVGPGLSWMAWTWQTGAFFAVVALILAVMTTLALLRPEVPRRGILGFPTTRGDRLFVTLLLTAVIHVAWIGLGFDIVWPPLAISILVGAAMFRWA